MSHHDIFLAALSDSLSVRKHLLFEVGDIMNNTTLNRLHSVDITCVCTYLHTYLISDVSI